MVSNKLNVILTLIIFIGLFFYMKKYNAPKKAEILNEEPQVKSSTPGKLSETTLQKISKLEKKVTVLSKAKGKSNSYLGGLPPYSKSLVWPTYKNRPLSFLACLELSKLSHETLKLPKEGVLLFFYDLEEQPWGFDPKDKNGWKIIHLKGLVSTEKKADIPKGLDAEYILKQKFVDIKQVLMPPAEYKMEVSELDLSDDELDAYSELRQAKFNKQPLHQLGGDPYIIQNQEMELQCQFASNGLFVGDATGYNDPCAKALKEGARDWQLLLQIDSDDELDLMWGDSGMIYFWLKTQDVEKGDFSKSWLILQCY